MMLVFSGGDDKVNVFYPLLTLGVLEEGGNFGNFLKINVKTAEVLLCSLHHIDKG
jgi:hypothetical protein